ncbi:biopolymer transporter ExbD [Alteromonas aestuariivivens]|uniref:Biopolymer transporter ExbD n=1 Tax=Alteromonas aestuariivivens TaxID=1938339 RepID=A0A3D8ME85_9ALTE|nr:biopolymer transporter ExbD [Alteromonas aestuariivivens]RDV28187.1 biopolymer transporter ExbD [Alteromonas aestuariivivens]
MMGRRKKPSRTEAELDITSFMNLMIVLVPVLLMMMVFSRITVVELQLPGIAGITDTAEIKSKQLEVLASPSGLAVFYPQGHLVRKLPLVASEGEGQTAHQDWKGLQLVLRQVKQTLLGKGVDKKDITLLIDDEVAYQDVIALLEFTRSYDDVIAASVVQAELFPQVSFADIPGELASFEQILARQSVSQPESQEATQ